MRPPGHRPRLAPLALALVALLAAPGGAAAAAAGKGGKGSTSRSKEPAQRPPSPALQKARAELAAVKKSPAKRRYRHNWEHAIHSLEKAARGPDTGPALLDAARARYALYRFSAVEADREAALRLASRAAKAGAPQGASLAAAIRKEAGDDPAPVAKAVRKVRPPAAAPAPVRRAEPAPPAPAVEDDEPLDPALQEALADGGDAPAGAATAPVPAAATTPAQVTEIHSWTSADYTRVAVYLSHPVAFEKLEIPADALHPRRLALDLRPAVLERPGQERIVSDAILHRVRTAQTSPDTVRIVLDLKGADAYQVFT
ncbi:MAG TPA: AMIN domain-containing protein, partial [Anaeromyxobacteraceae bacterium]|nr:AMIN domain-containing protein [Anaeromyxobacteraceae bacterium]